MSAAASPVTRALRDAGLAALVVAGLGFPIVAFRAEPDFNNVLALTSRWPLFLGFCAVGAALRFALSLWGARKKPAAIPVLEAAKPRRGWLGPAGGLALVAYPLLMLALLGPQASLKWVDTFGVQILLYVLLAWGLNITVGLAGLLDLGYVAFYAVGAYAYALLAPMTGLSFWALLPICGALAAFWGFCIGFPVLRLRGDYLAIVTLAFAEIVRTVLINWTDVTHGEAGLYSFPKLSFFGLPFINGPRGFDAHFGLHFVGGVHKLIFLYYIVLVLAFSANFVSIRLRRLPLGRAWEALREDEIACRALGLDTANIKLTAFALGAFFAGVAGCLFALRQEFVSPSSFTFTESATILAMVVLGGRGSQVGVAAAAVLIVGASELLRELNFLKSIFGPDFDPTQYRMLLVGLAMVAMMNFRPRGIVSSRQPTILATPLVVAEARP